MRQNPTLAILVQVCVVMLLTGCASLPDDIQRTASTALADPESTSVGRMFAREAAEHPGLSGFAVVSDSRGAYRARIAMIRLAEKTVDVQYYIWDTDATGGIMADELVKAADRGVRVRALIDDSTMSGRDNGLLAFDAHPNIEIRLFNPFANRGSRVWGYLTDLDRLNHRMHNKLIVMDNAVAIVGGRNIADHYFGVNEDENFRDLDIAAVGPIVRDISGSFDSFWNSDWAMPVDALLDADEEISREQYAENLQGLRERLAATPYPYPLEFDVKIVTDNILSLPTEFTWAKGMVAYDRPQEIATDEGTTSVIGVMREQMERTQSELLIEAAYFVPTDSGVERGCEMVARGIRVRVLTNSLASNDVAAAHAGYEKYRKDLLECGVELHELRIDSQDIRRDWSAIAITSKSLLHTKAAVFDGERLFIGSMNFDPRSTDINTEMGLLVESPALAAEVAAYMNEGANPRNSYTVQLDDRNDLQWLAEDADGQEVRYAKEPDTGALQRGAADIIKILPVESQL